MDLGLILRTLWRHKLIMLVAIFVGIWLAMSVSTRSYTTYETKIRMIVETPGSDLVKANVMPGEGVDLGRPVQLANVYAFLVNSEPVMKRLTADFGAVNESIDVQSIDGVPIIEINVTGAFPQRAERLAEALAAQFSSYIMELQDQGKISADNRVTVRTLDNHLPATPLKSRKMETVALMLMGPIFAGALLAFMSENLRRSLGKDRLDQSKEPADDGLADTPELVPEDA